MFNQQARWDRKMPGDSGPEWERAEVLCRFSGGKIFPLKFKAGGCVFTVSAINYTWSERRGKNLVYFFSVSDSRDNHCLSLEVETMSWRIAPLQ